LSAQGYRIAGDLKAAANMGASLCIIATETEKHAEDSLLAAANGFDILVEKPLGLNASEARRIYAGATEHGRSLYVGCVLRFADSLNTFRSMLPALGRVHSVRVECQTYLPDWRVGRSYLESYSSGEQGGVLHDLIHEIDYTAWIFGWPHEVQAKLRNLGRLGIAAEETADLIWEVATGPVISMTLDYVTRPGRRCMTALGEFGTLKWDGMDGTTTLSLANEPPRTMQFAEDRDEILRKQDQSFVNTGNGYADPRHATAEDGVRALSLCDSARHASISRREEKVVY
jgi:predicted dehydrogenase